MTTPVPENHPKTILTLSAPPAVDRRNPCRPDDFPPYPPKPSQYRDCRGFPWEVGHPAFLGYDPIGRRVR